MSRKSKARMKPMLRPLPKISRRVTFQNGGEEMPLFEEDYVFICRNVSTEFPSMLVKPDDHGAFIWHRSRRGALSPPRFPLLISMPCNENTTSVFSSILPNNDNKLTGILGILHEETKKRQIPLINGIRLPMRMGSRKNPFLANASLKCTCFSLQGPSHRLLHQDGDESFMPRMPKRTLEDVPTMPLACRPKHGHAGKQDENLPSKVLLPDF